VRAILPAFLSLLRLILLGKREFRRKLWTNYFLGGCMASVTGFGGAFVRAKDPKILYEWYEQHLGLTKSEGCFTFPAAKQRAKIVFAFFKQEDAYFPTAQKAMINLQVDDLDGVLDRLTAEGVTVDPKRDSYDFGKFGWFSDLEGNRVELWQPAAD
jgi:predicted enzyme related to lactoylglutathione lyase